MITVRASLLNSYPTCPRRFLAILIQSGAVPELRGEFPELRRLRQHVGAAVGTACHTGVTQLMQEVKRTGEKGGAATQKHIVTAAADHYIGLTRDEAAIMDGPSGPARNNQDAIMSVHKIVGQYHEDFEVTSEPILIEKDLVVERGRLTITGRPDYYLAEGKLVDFKSGRYRPSAYGQVGTYLYLLHYHRYLVHKAELHYAQRLSPRRRQTPIKRIPLQTSEALGYAGAIMGNIDNDFYLFGKWKDPEQFTANPNHPLCNPKFCCAYGTSFCPIGELTHGKARTD